MSQTLSLFRLQQVDAQIDRANIRLQVVQNLLNDDAELSLASKLVVSTETISRSAEHLLNQAETETRSLCIKIEQIESSLYNGKGHSPKELLDLQNDLAALKRHLITLEDIQLEAMLAVEKSQADIKAAQVELQKAQSRSTEQNRGLNEEQKDLRKELEKLIAERSAVAGPVPAEVLVFYDRLRQQRNGLAVAVISDNSCSACGSGLSAALMQSSRASGSMAFCPSCGRILYGS